MNDSPYKKRIWQNNYTPGLARDIDLSMYSSINRIFRDAVDTFSDRAAFDSFGGSVTFLELDRLTRDLAAWLQTDAGIRKGDRVAMMAPNTLGFVVGMFAIIRAGAVQVNVNPMYSPRELRHQLVDADVETMIIFSGSTPTLAEVIADTPVQRVIAFGLDDFVNRNLPSPPVDQRLAGVVPMTEAVGKGAKLEFNSPEMTLDDLLFLQYTGGTTGLSKAAMLTHGNLIANILQFEAMDSGVIRDGEETVLTAIPMYHIYALMVNTLYFFKRGGSNVLVTDPRDMQTFVRTWAAAKPTVTTGVNTLYNGLLHTPGFADIDFTGLKLAAGGGAPIQKAVTDRWHELTGSYIKEGYGLSETSPVVTVTLLSEPDYRPGIGLPVSGTDVSLRDDNDNEVPIGMPGELCVKGPQLMAGYWRQPEATAESMTSDGYFRTGDIATMDADGYFQIVDRKKDMILISGFNVYPNEIEAVLAAMPGLMETACVGVPDDISGEAVKVFAVRSDPAVSSEDIIAFAGERLSAYKVPRQVEFRDELPKSAVGKILRRELR
jgi:long-chain acyl-CoA synthetase